MNQGGLPQNKKKPHRREGLIKGEKRENRLWARSSSSLLQKDSLKKRHSYRKKDGGPESNIKSVERGTSVGKKAGVLVPVLGGIVQPGRERKTQLMKGDQGKKKGN